MNQHNAYPPKWPVRFLRFFLKKQFLEEIEGDLEEMFHDNVNQLSLKKARRIYAWEMVKLLRPILLKNIAAIQPLNHQGMFRNYFKVSVRGLMKNPLSSFINIFGLSAAIGICVFAFAFARWTFSTDQFHKNRNEVFLMTFLADRDGTEQEFGTTPRPLGEMLKSDFAQIKDVCRVEDRNVVMKHGDNVFHERVRFTDPSFLRMFTFPLKWGTAASLSDVNSIIVSEDMSVKYFGTENPIGQSILMIFDNEVSKAFKITGVAGKFPSARTIDFDFLINFENLRTTGERYDFQDWKAFVDATLIQVEKPSDLTIIKAGMERYRKIQNEAVQQDWAISSFGFEPLATLNTRSGDIRDDISASSSDNYKSIMFMSIIGGFLLVLACLNYINIAIVSAAKRLKEIGVRKSIGANRSTLIVQFLSENMVITFFAMVFGLILGVTFFIPGFEMLWPSLDLDFRFSDPALWIYLPAVLVFTSIVSGIYPSLYISRFQVVGILKGTVKFGNRNPLTKTFLAFQMILACVFITNAVMFTQNSNFLSQRTWGYDQSDALYANVPDQAAYEKLSAKMSGLPDVISISGSSHHIAKSHNTAVLHFPDREYEADQLAVDANYFQTMGIQLKEGRCFKDYEGSDRQAVVVNDLLVKNMGWMDPIGQAFRIDSIQYEVIGVTKEFHNYSFSKPVKPTIFTLADKQEYRYLTMKVTPGAAVKTYKIFQAKWAELFPETPFEGGYQEDVWGFYFEGIKIHGIVWRVFAFIAVLLAGLGLYGLVALNVAGRVKEFSIRKILGAGLKSILTNISRQYLGLFAVALVIGAPAGYLLARLILNFAYKYHMPMNFTGVIIAVCVLLSVLLITVSTQTGKVLKSNPVDGLKVE
jgi:ABC-type antimicrobial peptide transport system permease subunit